MHYALPFRNRRWGWHIGRVAAAFLVFALMTAVALAALPTTGTFVGADATRAQNVTFTNPVTNQTVTDGAGVLLLQLDRDAPGDKLGPIVDVFCIEVNILVRRNDTYTGGGSVNALPDKPNAPANRGCKIRYVLASHPASSVTTRAEGAAIQLAIWHFSDGLNLNTVTDAAIRARAQAIAAEAEANFAANGCPGTNTGLASLTITPANATVPQGQPVQLTAQITPAGAAPSVNITVDGGAVLNNGQASATVAFDAQGQAVFTVTNPNPGTVNVNATVPYVMDAGTVFNSNRVPTAGQQLVLGESVSLSASAQIQATFQQATPTNTATPTETPTVTNTPGGPTETPVSTATPTIPGNNTATPTATATATDVPTSTPRRSNPTRTPSSVNDTPTATAPVTGNETPTSTPGGGGEGTPTVVSNDGTPTIVPGSEQTPAADVTPGTEGTPNVPVQANANAAKPRSLPNTGEGSSAAAEWLLALAATLVVAGIALQRRGARR